MSSPINQLCSQRVQGFKDPRVQVIFHKTGGQRQKYVSALIVEFVTGAKHPVFGKNKDSTEIKRI